MRNFALLFRFRPRATTPSVLRGDFRGRRLDLYFDDVVDGPGAATPADIEGLFDFGQEWVSAAHSDPAMARIVLHCAAGVSRSAAAGLLLLNLYFGTYRQAAAHLLRTHPHVVPNVLVLRLIFDKLGPAYGADIFAAVTEGKRDSGILA